MTDFLSFYLICLCFVAYLPGCVQENANDDIIKELVGRINNLEEKVKEMPKMKQRINALEEEVKEMPKLRHKIQSCEMEIKNISTNKRDEHEIQDYKRFPVDGVPHAAADSASVSFYVHYNNFGPVGQQHTFIFETVLFNIGQAYNKVNGEFTTKVPGTYFFIWTVSARNNMNFETELVVNGAVYGQVRTDATNHWATATGFVIVRLNINDIVWIRSGPANNGHDTGVGYVSSSFGGYLLHQ